MHELTWPTKLHTIRNAQGVLEEREPTIGRWYCAFYERANGEFIDGPLGEYVGDGVFDEDVGYGPEDVDMGDYAFLVEQI